MVEISYWFLISTCSAIIIWGLIKLDRIYQYPFFMAAITIAFILPQVSALISNPLGVTEGAIARVIIVTILCLLMCFLGYHYSKPNPTLLAKLQIPINHKKLVRAAFALAVLGWIFTFLTRQYASSFSAGELWSGPATIFAFFSQVVYISFAIFLLEFLKKKSYITFMGILISASPIITTILAGRRQPTMTFIIIIGLCLWLTLRLLPSRLIVVTILILGIYIIPVVGQLRSEFWTLVFQGNFEALQYEAKQSFDKLQVGQVLELRNAALAMDYSSENNDYEYGAGYWNAFVFQYVPGQLVGRDLKQSLQFKTRRIDKLNSYQYDFPIGTTWTGIGDSFLQFGYLGCLVFALIGILFKTLWVSTVQYRSPVAPILMMGLISPAMLGITHGTERFLQEMIFQFMVIIIVAQYSRLKSNYAILTDLKYLK